MENLLNVVAKKYSIHLSIGGTDYTDQWEKRNAREKSILDLVAWKGIHIFLSCKPQMIALVLNILFAEYFAEYS